jgi:hypothetical protein
MELSGFELLTFCMPYRFEESGPGRTESTGEPVSRKNNPTRSPRGSDPV